MGIEINPQIRLLAPVNNPTVMKSFLVPFQMKWEMQKCISCSNLLEFCASL